MSAFPVMNPSMQMGGKAALVAKLMQQYQQKKGMRNPGYGVSGAGQPFRGAGPLSKLSIRGGGGSSASSLIHGALSPSPLQGDDMGMPGSSVDQPPINQQSGLQGWMASLAQGSGSPGFPPDMPGAGGGTTPGGAVGTTSQGYPTYPLSPEQIANNPGAGSTSVDPGFYTIGNTGGVTWDPITGTYVYNSPGPGQQTAPASGSKFFYS